MSPAVASPPIETRSNDSQPPRRLKSLLLTNKGIASLYIMDREPVLRAKFAELYDLLKGIERTNTVDPKASRVWLDYALNKGYYEKWQ